MRVEDPVLPIERADERVSATVLRNARRIGDDSEPVDIVIERGILVETVASGAEAAHIIDLDGRFVGPGLWDAHVHMEQWAQLRQRVDLAGAGSPADVADRFRTRVVATVGREVIVGYGFRDALWSEPMRRALLDDVGGNRPVVAISGDLHCVWLNAAASQRLGVTTDDTGVLREAAAIDVVTQLDSVPDEQMDRWVAEAARAAAERGVVGLVEFEWADNIAAWTRRAGRARLDVRVVCGVYPEYLDAAIARGLRTGASLSGSEGLAVVGPLKVITDGSLNTRTALCHDPYSDSEPGQDAHGRANVDPSTLEELLRWAAASGFVPAVHAIGDRANQLVLDTFQALGIGGSIEHAQLVSADDFHRFGELGLTASVQPEHALDDRDVADRLWRGRTARAFALRSLRSGGARLALGSDAPVAPLDPWISMAAAVHRTRDGREPWHPEQSLTMREAYEASTREGRLDLRPGDPADLVICDENPLHLEGGQIRSASVAGTMLAGRWTHRGF
jgi:predicted amidohydrolase YtcJ